MLLETPNGSSFLRAMPLPCLNLKYLKLIDKTNYMLQVRDFPSNIQRNRITFRPGDNRPKVPSA